MTKPGNKTPVAVHLETHVLQNGDLSNFVFDMPGQLFQMGKNVYLRFEEDDNHDGHPVPVTVKIDANGEIKLTRGGQNEIHLHFIEGKKLDFHYHTMFGPLLVQLYTEKIDLKYQDQPFSGDLNIKYQLFNNKEVVGNYQIELHFTV